MKPVAWMVAASVISWLAVTAVAGKETAVALFLGMIAPLVVAAASWAAIERTHRRNPAAVTRLMVGAFAGKMVLFGAYVALVVGVLRVTPVPFVASFTGYFIGLYLAEALLLRRLFSERR